MGMYQFLYKNNILRILVIFTCCALALPAFAQHVPVSVERQGDGVHLSFTLPYGAQAKTFSLNNPPRLVVDVPNVGKAPVINQSGSHESVLNIRSGQFNANTGRIVVELRRQFTMSHHQNGTNLSVTIRPHGSVVATEPSGTPQPKALPKPALKPEKKIIVLDAGHGGQDPGAMGKDGTKEKNLVLKFTHELKDKLEASGKYKVVLTRAGDYYIPLRERVAYARKHSADIFMSIHADSASSAARGLSVYTLSENASDDEAAALAAKENRSDIIAGVDLGEHDKDVANILISLAQRETNNQSAILADTLVTSLQNQGIGLLTRPHRFAGFAVLKAPDVPSVLIEIGFISNRDEEKALNKSSHRSKLASGLLKALDHYFEHTSKAL